MQLTPKQREKAERIVAQGMQSFALKRGVLGSGLLVFVALTAWFYFGSLITHTDGLFDRKDLSHTLTVLLLFSLVMGYVRGVCKWWIYKRLLERQRR